MSNHFITPPSTPRPERRTPPPAPRAHNAGHLSQQLAAADDPILLDPFAQLNIEEPGEAHQIVHQNLSQRLMDITQDFAPESPVPSSKFKRKRRKRQMNTCREDHQKRSKRDDDGDRRDQGPGTFKIS